MEPSFELRSKHDAGILSFAPLRRPSTPQTSARPPRIFGESLAMRAAYRLIDRVASTDGTVIVTGKEPVTHVIHDHSRRGQGHARIGNLLARTGQQLTMATFGHCGRSRKTTAEVLGISDRTLMPSPAHTGRAAGSARRMVLPHRADAAPARARGL